MSIAGTGCERTDLDTCTKTSEVDVPFAVAIGAAGAAALGAGILWFALGGGGDGEPGVSARISPLGGEIRATF